MKRLSRAELETRVRDLVIRFQKEFLGRGPKLTRAFLVGEHVLIVARLSLTPAEEALGDGDGAEMVRQMYRAQVEQGRAQLSTAVQETLGVRVRTFHVDLCPRTGETVLVLGLDGRPDGGNGDVAEEGK
jgi:uncharacterized protein YbcI